MPRLDDVQLEAFCAREYPRLVRMLRLYCGDEHVAQELAQEALVRVVANWPKVRGLESPGGWAHRVAVNLANSGFRRQAAARRARQRLQAATSEHTDPDVAEVVAVRAAVASLPPRQREALVLCHLRGLDPAEAAQLMGCSAQAVRNLTHRARQSLRPMLADLQEVDDAR